MSLKTNKSQQKLRTSEIRSKNKQLASSRHPYGPLAEGPTHFFVRSLSRVIFPIHKPLSLAPVWGMGVLKGVETIVPSSYFARTTKSSACRLFHINSICLQDIQYSHISNINKISSYHKLQCSILIVKPYIVLNTLRAKCRLPLSK